MLSEGEQELYYAVRKAQLNRNTATKILAWDPCEGKQLLTGTFIRVLIKLPLQYQPESYAIAYVRGTIEGTPYRGFSTDLLQETNVYLLAALPHALAEHNGTQFQLNSISNSRMNIDEFMLWLQLMREEGAAIPSLSELNTAGERVRAFEQTQRPRTGGQSVPFYTNSHNSPHANYTTTLLDQAQGRHQELSPEPPTMSPNTDGTRHGQVRSYPQATPSQPQLSPNLRSSLPSMPRAQVNQLLTTDLGCSTSLQLGGLNSSAAGESATLPGYPSSRGRLWQRSNSMPMAGSTTEVSSRPFVPNQSPPRDQGPSCQVSGAIRRLGSREGASFSMNNSLRNHAQLLSGSELRPRGMGPEESEDDATDRVLRQEIMNNLQQSRILFPKDTSGYKLSQLRLVERDMIEYLQQLREEMAAKQENCVVCMDHVPTVILLPCRHKVMCRLCAPSCGVCPVCRSTIEEMFEITEI